jgi:hypothetical protein
MSPPESASRSGRDALWRALHREALQLRDPRRIAAVVITSASIALITILLFARGDAGGVDAQTYWAAARIWLAGGNPYDTSGPYLLYVYPSWMLPLFVPLALLPWDVAWFVWRGGTILLLLVSYHWAYRRHPLRSSLVLAALSLPIAVNLDTGNVNLLLILALWVAQFSVPAVAGILWALATWMKWLPVVFFVVLAPRGRLYGLIGLAVSAVLSLVLLPLTIAQLHVLFGVWPARQGVRLDYLVFLWAAVPWWYLHIDDLAWIRRMSWSRIRANIAEMLRSRRALRLRLRRSLGLPA